MRLRDWGRRTTPEEFPLQYRAQFHAESVFQCEDPQTGYHGLTFVRRRGPYNFDFLSPRNNYITVTFVTDKPNSGVIDYVRIKTRWRSCLVDVRPVTMTATKRPGTRYRFDSTPWRSRFVTTRLWTSTSLNLKTMPTLSGIGTLPLLTA